MQVVDPHIHLWDLERLHYGWLKQQRTTFMGDHSSLAKTYSVAEFLSDVGDIEVLKVVHVEAGHDPTNPVAETRWLQSLADQPKNSHLPNAIVAYADLLSPDVERLFAAHVESPNVRGIRQILNVHTNPLYDYVGRHLIQSSTWQANFGLLQKYSLSFDLQIYPTQMREAAALAARHDETMLILNHTGMFADRGSVTGWRTWRDGMRALATHPNVAVKISGLGMIDHNWTVESIRPYALETIDAFGVERTMFASNFPVDRLYGTYERQWRAFAAIVADASEAEKAALFRQNAERIYRI
jgi:predicted TIM-barrel fold metal-dependent hydrolase